ncbi:MAG: metalloregulator ArsR/SmtB family transcription factor [Candidatus Thorarchaeota archaeon]|nr:metalloregulator ArsR/SmtB family transcription factor [Candidatus Thorarchaeota archaeon]
MADKKTVNRCVEFHKALSNPVRLQIVEELIDGELCQCELAPRIGLAQSTISSYLSQLVRANILSERREGQRKIYWISSEKIAALLKKIRRVLAEEAD